MKAVCLQNEWMQTQAGGRLHSNGRGQLARPPRSQNILEQVAVETIGKELWEASLEIQYG